MTDDKRTALDQNTEAEMAKLLFEFCKHLTTLSTGSVLLLVTFLEKLFSNPQWKFAVGLSFGSFVLSILSSLLAMLVLSIGFSQPHRTPSDTERIFWGVFGLTALVSFFGGILLLVIFALKNIY